MAEGQAELGRGRWRMLRRNGDLKNGSVVEAAVHFVERLAFPGAATWSDLQSAVEHVYGKPIYLVASNSSSLRSVTGLWIDTKEFGAVVCRERDELPFQSQNACHELAHILFACAPADWFNELLPRREGTSADQSGAMQLCPVIDDSQTLESQTEIAIEEVAFAMSRRIQSVTRTVEEAYFG